MESIAEKFKRSSVHKRTLVDYSIRVERPSLDSPLAKTSKIEIFHPIPKTSPQSPSSTLPTSARSNKRFNTVNGKAASDISSKPSLDKSFFDLSIDFNVSMKIFKKDQNFVESDVNRLERKASFSNSVKERILKNYSKPKKSKKEGKSFIEEENCDKEKFEEKKTEFEVVEDEISVVDTFEDRADNKTEIMKEQQDKAKTKRKIRIMNQRQTELQFFNFFLALDKFYLMPAVYVEINLWSVSFFQRCCCIKDKNNLSPELQELCEKIIIFAYTELDPINSFHSNLIRSVQKRLEQLMNNTESCVYSGFSSNNPYEKDLKHNIAPFGLLLILFLIEYLPMTLESMIKYCLGYEIAFIPLAFDVAEIVILTIRKKKLNEIMMQTQKCLETLCFFYAGCLGQWFVLHKEEQNDLWELNKKLEKQAMSDVNSLIELAKSLLKFQNY